MPVQKNNHLGKIDYAHLVHADKSGAGCAECRRLAELHIFAVDYAKTGVVAPNEPALPIPVGGRMEGGGSWRVACRRFLVDTSMHLL